MVYEIIPILTGESLYNPPRKKNKNNRGKNTTALSSLTWLAGKSKCISYWKWGFSNVMSWSLTAKAWKMDGWKTILSYWGQVTFQRRALKLREGTQLCGDYFINHELRDPYYTLLLLNFGGCRENVFCERWLYNKNIIKSYQIGSRLAGWLSTKSLIGYGFFKGS